MILPRLALSVRQPWAWAIIHGKDIENRSWSFNGPPHKDAKRLKSFAVHAATGMTRYEYEDASELITKILGHGPPAHELVRGAVIGAVELSGLVRERASPWFLGPLGLVLANPVACTPIRSSGQLGFFEWKESTEPMPEPARWMLPKAPHILNPPLQTGPGLPVDLWTARDLTDWKPDPTAGSATVAVDPAQWEDSK
jgi:hypothetical protein